jgi:hemerythrin superfamily protein
MPASRKNARDQVIELLKQDHALVKKQFRQFEKMDSQEDREACQQIAQTVCGMLEAHATLEEELFYPAARSALEGKQEGEDLLDEAEVEHSSVKMLVSELKGLGPEDPKFSAHMTVLSEYVKHHVKEEEGEMFTRLTRAKFDWEPVLQEMLDRHQELQAQHGLAEAEEMTASQPGGPSRSRSQASHSQRGR